MSDVKEEPAAGSQIVKEEIDIKKEGVDSNDGSVQDGATIGDTNAKKTTHSGDSDSSSDGEENDTEIKEELLEDGTMSDDAEAPPKKKQRLFYGSLEETMKQKKTGDSIAEGIAAGNINLDRRPKAKLGPDGMLM
ncbi:hypothetical protein SARC_13268 [Sphaeroforma arctica JP610]|uniref:Uncharacterized protein n=1 Tax=Sphaeroforma arctica JP610 TaxID=667725 RepID=A0A0L0FDP4_9EUKA|nr:hypothetical protein SARC_13268 [Sphaeroforma arctica JP610]KNC74178.1 hypothetical protein SARC_13268 [Sphaeroforma arctica JP610]|eukprot:XP_014148080.1 hypothetical protein SARC_13268 [Sphaeroforma arctica JP610]